MSREFWYVVCTRYAVSQWNKVKRLQEEIDELKKQLKRISKPTTLVELEVIRMSSQQRASLPWFRMRPSAPAPTPIPRATPAAPPLRPPTPLSIPTSLRPPIQIRPSLPPPSTTTTQIPEDPVPPPPLRPPTPLSISNPVRPSTQISPSLPPPTTTTTTTQILEDPVPPPPLRPPTSPSVPSPVHPTTQILPSLPPLTTTIPDDPVRPPLPQPPIQITPPLPVPISTTGAPQNPLRPSVPPIQSTPTLLRSSIQIRAPLLPVPTTITTNTTTQTPQDPQPLSVSPPVEPSPPSVARFTMTTPAPMSPVTRFPITTPAPKSPVTTPAALKPTTAAWPTVTTPVASRSPVTTPTASRSPTPTPAVATRPPIVTPAPPPHESSVASPKSPIAIATPPPSPPTTLQPNSTAPFTTSRNSPPTSSLPTSPTKTITSVPLIASQPNTPISKNVSTASPIGDQKGNISGKSPTPVPSPKREARLVPERQSPKINSLARPPSPLTLPPAQINPDDTKIEQKNVLVQQTIEKPAKGPGNGNVNSVGKKEPTMNDANENLSSSRDWGTRMITLAGENKGAVMELSPSRNKSYHSRSPHTLDKHNTSKLWTSLTNDEKSSNKINDEQGSSKSNEKNKRSTVMQSPPTSAYLNSNVQGINNSILLNFKCKQKNPGIHLSLTRKPSNDHHDED